MVKTTSFTGHHIYAGLDIGKTSWKVCILTEQVEHKTFTQPPSAVVLVQYLKRNFPGATYHCVYEAGRFGFWIHDQLVHEANSIYRNDKRLCPACLIPTHLISSWAIRSDVVLSSGSKDFPR